MHICDKRTGSDQTPREARIVWSEPVLFVPLARFSQMTLHNKCLAVSLKRNERTLEIKQRDDTWSPGISTYRIIHACISITSKMNPNRKKQTYTKVWAKCTCSLRRLRWNVAIYITKIWTAFFHYTTHRCWQYIDKIWQMALEMMFRFLFSHIGI